MFEEFAKKKFDEYIQLIPSNTGFISLQEIRHSNLPPYIINYFECSLEQKLPVNKKVIEELLNKGIVLYINYVIKPKQTLLKFIFGSLESKPVDIVSKKLRYFQFYNYYIQQINNFISVNQPLFVSSEQVKTIINDVNKKIFQEISIVEAEQERLNLIKLLYHFFLDLTENNPINIQLPKKILSVFFQDKGFLSIKQRTDSFFADEIYIQEAVKLMPPTAPQKKISEDEEEKVNEFLSKAKDISSAVYVNPDILNIKLKVTEDLEKLSSPQDKQYLTEIENPEFPDEIPGSSIKSTLEENKLYSEELLLTPLNKQDIKTEDESEIVKKLIYEIFCEDTKRKEIIKKLFGKDVSKFEDTVRYIISSDNWEDASIKIEEYFLMKKINFYTDEAVKFVDLIENYFINQNTRFGSNITSENR